VPESYRDTKWFKLLWICTNSPNSFQIFASWLTSGTTCDGQKPQTVRSVILPNRLGRVKINRQVPKPLIGYVLHSRVTWAPRVLQINSVNEIPQFYWSRVGRKVLWTQTTSNPYRLASHLDYPSQMQFSQQFVDYPPVQASKQANKQTTTYKHVIPLIANTTLPPHGPLPHFTRRSFNHLKPSGNFTYHQV
jgi:hypothetical protein